MIGPVRCLVFPLPLLLALAPLGCSGGDGTTGSETDPGDLSGIDFRQEMRDLVEELSTYAKTQRSSFLLLTQNGQELVTQNGEPDGLLSAEYVAALDGVGQEDLFYGYEEDDAPTPPSESDWLVAFLDLIEANGKEVLVTDYCSTREKMTDSYAQSALRGYISFAADHRNLDDIPGFPEQPHAAHPDSVNALSGAENFLYLISPESFGERSTYLHTLAATDYDLLLVDAFYDGVALSGEEVESLKRKPVGSTRLVIAYMSIGEAEDYRFYWEDEWAASPPAWLEEENPDWPGNYVVRYWDPEWQGIIYGTSGSYLDRILEAGFDGVYLDIIEGYEFFEERVGEGRVSG